MGDSKVNLWASLSSPHCMCPSPLSSERRKANREPCALDRDVEAWIATWASMDPSPPPMPQDFLQGPKFDLPILIFHITILMVYLPSTPPRPQIWPSNFDLLPSNFDFLHSNFDLLPSKFDLLPSNFDLFSRSLGALSVLILKDFNGFFLFYLPILYFYLPILTFYLPISTFYIPISTSYLPILILYLPILSFLLAA